MIKRSEHADVHNAFKHSILDKFHKKQEEKTEEKLDHKHKENYQNKHILALGIICLYKVTSNGGLKKTNEVNIKMGRYYIPSKDGNMTLTRSYDKKWISLTKFDPRDMNHFKVKAWCTQLEGDHEFAELNQGLDKYFEAHKKSFNSLVSVTFTGRRKLVELVYLEEKKRTDQEKEDYEKNIEEKLQGRKK